MRGMKTSWAERARWRRARWRRALGMSAALHATAIVGVWGGTAVAQWLNWLPTAELPAAPPLELIATTNWDALPSLDHVPATQIEPADSPVGGAFVERQVEQAIDDARKQSPDQQLDRLRELSDQLSDVSSDKSLDELSNQFQKWLGTKPRATQPTDKRVEGPFDFQTAQVHDVRRTERDDGTFRYSVVLLDAAGRSLETELTEAEGEQLYRTFELIKQNPLLEKVYRQVVMSLLDKLLEKPRP